MLPPEAQLTRFFMLFTLKKFTNLKNNIKSNTTVKNLYKSLQTTGIYIIWYSNSIQSFISYLTNNTVLIPSVHKISNIISILLLTIKHVSKSHSVSGLRGGGLQMVKGSPT